MQYVKFENDYVLRIDRGEEIVEAVKEFAKAEGIKLASLSGIGAVNKAVVGLFDTREKNISLIFSTANSKLQTLPAA
jgi:Predicted DNA-binding protein with PD1-like DNA-binding motif